MLTAKTQRTQRKTQVFKLCALCVFAVQYYFKDDKMHRMVVCFLVIGLLIAGIGEGSAGAQEKSGKKAFFLSLLIPGAGQVYVGEKGWAKAFLLSEGMLWLGYAGFREYESWGENDYRVFASVHAGVDPKGKDAAFFDDVGFYDSVYARNRVTRWEEGSRIPLYAEQPRAAWEWDSEASRRKFRSLRSSSIRADRRALYVVGAIMLNHVMSAIHAARSPSPVLRPRGGEGERGRGSVGVWSFMPDVRSESFGLVWVRRF